MELDTALLRYWKHDEVRRCFIIAEVAQSHEGSVGQAHAFIDAVAATGANAIKFQTHIASQESTVREQFRTNFSYQDHTRYDYWRRMEFTEEQWSGLATHARERSLVFLSSPFSFEAVRLLERLNMTMWKVASGEVSNIPQLDLIASTGKPVLLSSGMSRWNELQEAVDFLHSKGSKVAVLQATSCYPTPPEKVGLNVMVEMKEKLCVPVGLSDHSGSIFPSLAAFALGGTFLEVHVALSRAMFGPDVSSSIAVDELKQLVEGVRCLEKVLNHPVEKDQVADELAAVRVLFSKSIVAARHLVEGTILSDGDVCLKKPGSGLAPDQLHRVYGRRLRRALSTDEILAEEDME